MGRFMWFGCCIKSVSSFCESPSKAAASILITTPFTRTPPVVSRLVLASGLETLLSSYGIGERRL